MTRHNRLITITGMLRLIVVGLLGSLGGVFVAATWNPLPLGPREQMVPAAYGIPKIPGGTSLRLAMVHDVLHERYLRHGRAWYLRRNELAQAVIDREAAAPSGPPSAEYLDALDDLAVGLERLGQYDESIATLRKKLVLVSPLPAPATMEHAKHEFSDAVDAEDLRRILAARNLPLKEHHQYTTCANLGTVLVHGAMPKALTGDAKAKATVREGLGYIERAIGINPGAHFGRERWQAIAIEHFLAVIDHPALATAYNVIGAPLRDELRSSGIGYSRRGRTDVPDSELTPDQRVVLRSSITRVGIFSDWVDLVHPDYTQPMPFDEPTLAIIGMWTLGGGPNPHFALALGTIMDTIGQRSIAWNAYERAAELGDGFGPDRHIRETLIDHCRERQAALAEIESPGDPGRWQDQMRAQHQKELAWGERYQKEYQEYEGAQIAAGVSLSDPHFYDAFFAGRPSIASPPGRADDYILTSLKASRWIDLLPCMMLGAALGMTLALVLPEKHLSFRSGRA